MSAWRWPILALMTLVVFNLILNPSYLSFTIRDGNVYGNLIDILFRSGPVMLAALGMTFVIATGGVDLSVGSTAALASAMVAFGFASGFPLAVNLAIAFAVAAAVGLFNGLQVAIFKNQPIVATLITMIVARGAAQLVVDGHVIPFSDPNVAWLGRGHWLGLPVSLWLVTLLVVILPLITRKTALGLLIEAVGSNPVAARYSGIQVKSYQLAVYVLSAGLAALSGLLISFNIQAADASNVGVFLELDAILAVVIGGTKLSGGRFSLFGSVLGALVLQTLLTTINAQGVLVQSIPVIKAVVVLVICLLQSPQFWAWKKVHA